MFFAFYFCECNVTRVNYYLVVNKLKQKIMAEIYQLPENGNGNSGFGNIPFSIPIGGFGFNNGYGNGIGYGMNGIFDIFALALVASMFGGWGNGGFGGGGFGGGNAAGFLANQLNNDSGRELLMNAITSQGEAGRAATQNLATTLGQDFDLVNSAVQNVQTQLCNLAAQQGMSTLQVINAIQGGDASLSRQLCECCCENRLLTAEQGYQAQIRTIEQTNQLGSQADRNTASVVGAINALQANMTKEFCDVKEREMQEKINTQSDIITQLRGQIDNAQQTAAITGYVNSLVSPLIRDVDDIKCKMPQTVPVQWPQLTAVNTTPYVSGGFYGQNWNGFFGGNGFGGNIVF